jgi:PAS domain S-box-containing protein
VQRPATIYLTAFAALFAAIVLRWLLDPIMGDTLPLVTLFGAVAVTVWVGGYRPGVIVALLGYLASDYLFIEPRGELGLDNAQHVVGLLAYILTCALIIGIGSAMRRARSSADERGEVLRVTLASIGDGVITTDNDGRVTYLNAVAESLTGWTREEALRQPLDAVFRIVNEETRLPVENPAVRALREGVIVGLTNHTVLIRKDGSDRFIDDSAAPIRNDRGEVSGCVLVFRDISSRRRLEHMAASRLRDARLLASIVESSDDAIVSKSLGGIIQSWNAGAERIFGYPASEAVGRHISLVIPPERIGEEDKIIASLRAGQRVEHFETERVRKDGRRIWVSLTISPIKDDQGQVVGASKIVRDITEQRHAAERERALLAEAVAANAKFRAFFDQGALFAGIVSTDGTVVEPNRLSWEGCGYTREQIVGKPFWEGPWWTPSAALVEQIKAGAAEAAAGKSYRAELPYYVADGSQRMADVVIGPIKDDTGRVLFLAPMGTDITERKLAEAEREKFVTLVENSTDFIGICDLAGVPTYVNPAGLKMAGLGSMAEARAVHVRDFFYPEDQSRMMDDFFPTVVAKGHAEIEVRFRHFRTGEARWMDYKVLKLLDANGEAAAFATVSQDVTERKALEDNLRRLAADLSEADRRKDEFLATLSHELRNPLAPLRNSLEILKRGNGQREFVPRALDTMERQLQQLVRLVDDLLDLSRITHNRIELRKGELDIASVIHQAVDASRPLAESAGHEIEVDVPPEPMYVLADPVRMTQIVDNLLNNAFKYTPQGGKVNVTARPQDNFAVVTVKDTGIGIPADKLESIFEMFTQLDRSLDRSQAGLGLGLTLVKRLVEAHGGTIEARSAGTGQGSEFIVRLPLMAERSKTTPAASSSDDASLHAHRILIVDDNRDAAVSLATLLQITGHETFMSHDGRAAIEAAQKHRPDLVLLDIGLPTFNGYEVCRQIRGQPWGKEMVLIALTGWGQSEDRRKSRDAGFDGHLVKPVNYGDLVKMLRTLVAARRPEEQPVVRDVPGDIK